MDFIMPNSKDTDSDIFETYKKLREDQVTLDGKISEKDQAIIDKECEVIKNREIIYRDPIHEPI